MIYLSISVYSKVDPKDLRPFATLNMGLAKSITWVVNSVLWLFKIETNSCAYQVKQLMAVDGRLHTKFDIPSTGSAHNYTRSYYMNGRDYIISGSCDEPVVHICCAQTGRRLRDVYVEVYFSHKHKPPLHIFLTTAVLKMSSIFFHCRIVAQEAQCLCNP